MKYWFLGICVFLTSCSDPDTSVFSGYVEGENIYLASPFSGHIKKLLINRGDAVKQGQVLIVLEQEPQSFALMQAKSELSKAKDTLADIEKPRRTQEINAILEQIHQVEADLTLLALRVKRNRQLYEKQAVDKDRLDAAVTRYQLNEHKKKQLEENLALARLGSRIDRIKAQKNVIKSMSANVDAKTWQLKQKSILAPASGVIFDTYYKQGEFVANAKAIASLLAPENIRIQFYAPLSAVNQMKIGQQVTVDCYDCSSSYQATISYISPQAEYAPPLVYSRSNSNKLVYRIKAIPKKPNLFKPGLPVYVTLGETRATKN